MIAAGPHRSGGQKEAHVQGWLVSVLLHGTVALAAILLVKQIQLAPQDEAFKWNVAMVSPTQPVQPTASPQNQAPAPISSVDDLGSLSPRAADCAGTDAPVAPAACATDDSIDF